MNAGRVLGLLVDLGYERQREVDAEWVETYLSEAFTDNEVLKEIVEGVGTGETGPNATDESLEGLEELEELRNEAEEAATDSPESATHRGGRDSDRAPRGPAPTHRR